MVAIEDTLNIARASATPWGEAAWRSVAYFTVMGGTVADEGCR